MCSTVQEQITTCGQNAIVKIGERTNIRPQKGYGVSCADPDSFVRGGPCNSANLPMSFFFFFLFFFWGGGGRDDPNNITSWPISARLRKGI